MGRRHPLTVELLSISISRSRGATGGLLFTLRYSYEVKPPNRKARIEMAKGLMREALQSLEVGEVADLGFREDSPRRVRVDQWET